jgi:hypothetical protein
LGWIDWVGLIGLDCESLGSSVLLLQAKIGGGAKSWIGSAESLESSVLLQEVEEERIVWMGSAECAGMKSNNVDEANWTQPKKNEHSLPGRE